MSVYVCVIVWIEVFLFTSIAITYKIYEIFYATKLSSMILAYTSVIVWKCHIINFDI